MGTANTFRELLVWQKAMDLVTEVYKSTSNYPESEKYGLISQICRSSVSIPTNIAEGFGRRTNKDFKRFLRISMGSLFELQTEIEIARNLGFLPSNLFEVLYEQTRKVERMLSSLIVKTGK